VKNPVPKCAFQIQLLHRYFVAKPITLRDGSVNMLIWECKVGGLRGTSYESSYAPVACESAWFGDSTLAFF
jgi:hypothetical protein